MTARKIEVVASDTAMSYDADLPLRIQTSFTI
jgi:hypothetical protein